MMDYRISAWIDELYFDKKKNICQISEITGFTYSQVRGYLVNKCERDGLKFRKKRRKRKKTAVKTRR